MHSFDKNASAVLKKRDNWGLLLKALKRLDVLTGRDAVTTREWEAVCAAEDGAAVELISRLHRNLSGPGMMGRVPESGERGGEQRGGYDDRNARGFSGERDSRRAGDWDSTERQEYGHGRDHGRNNSHHYTIASSFEANDNGDRMTSFGHTSYGSRAELPREMSNDVDVRDYGAEPKPFRFQPGGGGGFDWDAYQKVYMSPTKEDIGDGGMLETGGGSGGSDDGHDERNDHSCDETSYDDEPDVHRHVAQSSGGQRRPMRPLRDRLRSPERATGRGDIQRSPHVQRSSPRNRAPHKFDGGASLLDWGPSLPHEEGEYGEEDGYGGDGYGRDGGYGNDVYGNDGYGNDSRYDTQREYRPQQQQWEREESADRDRRERSYREASANARRGAQKPKPKQKQKQPSKQPPRRDASGDENEHRRPRRDSANSGASEPEKVKNRGAATGFYNPTFYEMKYDKGEARGVATYKQLGVGGYYGKNEQPSEAQIRARSEGPYAGQYGMDYAPKRVSEYKRMLGDDGQYYKLGSLGKDLDTEEQIMARERREAIKEHDRVIREQNRLAAERSADILRRKGIAPPKPEQSRKGFLSHVGDRDPRILNANAPSKHEKMWAYANRFIPKPAQAPPKEIPEAPPRVHGVWKRPADEPHEFAEKKDNFRGEWPHEWGGAPEVRGPHENAPRKDRGRRGVRLQPDPIHDRGAKRELSELEQLEMEHRIHQQKLRELSLV